MKTNQVDWAGEVANAISAMKEEGAKAYTYLKQEAPEVGAEYVRWQITKGAMGAAPMLVASAIAFVFAVKSYRTWKKELAEIEYEHHRGDWGFGAIMACIVSMFCLFWAFAFASVSVKAIVAPRIVIIEGIKEVVR